MNVREMSRDQQIELKQVLLDRRHPKGVSYNELIHADELVSDDEFYEWAQGINFVEEEFIS